VYTVECMLFSRKVMVRIRFSVWFVSGYAHVCMPFVVIVPYPNCSCCFAHYVRSYLALWWAHYMIVVYKNFQKNVRYHQHLDVHFSDCCFNSLFVLLYPFSSHAICDVIFPVHDKVTVDKWRWQKRCNSIVLYILNFSGYDGHVTIWLSPVSKNFWSRPVFVPYIFYTTFICFSILGFLASVFYRHIVWTCVLWLYAVVCRCGLLLSVCPFVCLFLRAELPENIRIHSLIHSFIRNVFFLIYEHALVILSSYPSTLHCCIKSHLLWESYISILASDLLDSVCDCDFILNVAFLLYVRLSHE